MSVSAREMSQPAYPQTAGLRWGRRARLAGAGYMTALTVAVFLPVWAAGASAGMAVFCAVTVALPALALLVARVPVPGLRVGYQAAQADRARRHAETMQVRRMHDVRRMRWLDERIRAGQLDPLVLGEITFGQLRELAVWCQQTGRLDLAQTARQLAGHDPSA